MLRLEMLPARCGDCLWLEYGAPTDPRIVIIDGGLTDSAGILRRRIDRARVERGGGELEVELLVVTHIDTDHILGIIELLGDTPDWLNIKDIWFNGRRQLMRLPTPDSLSSTGNTEATASGDLPPDLMGGAGDAENAGTGIPDQLASPADLLGIRQGDDLSQILEGSDFRWNHNPTWDGEAIMLPGDGDLPVVTLDGDLALTLLGPTLPRLYGLCAKWTDVLGGIDEPPTSTSFGPADLLGRGDTWPPKWQDKTASDPSVANGSSIMLLAEYQQKFVLLAGDGHAPDIANALERFRQDHDLDVVQLEAFKLPHHASANNIDEAVLDLIDCERYLISTDGSNHRHPDHLALLRVLKFSKRRPKLMFNYAAATTSPWHDLKDDVVHDPFQDYDTQFPANAADGLTVEVVP
jgi:glyoxylase-like metal-dependent hydrolase (beta-lactamase superfamily II)